MSETLTERVYLPSKGQIYDKSLGIGDSILIRPFTTKDEKGLYGGTNEGVDILIDNCINQEHTFKSRELCSEDKALIILRLRAITLGANYGVEYVCPHCGKRFSYSWDLNALQVKYLDLAEYPMKLELPVSKESVGFRYLTDKDRDEVEETMKTRKQLFPSFDLDTERHGYTIAQQVILYGNRPKDLISKVSWYEELHPQDSAYLDYINSLIDIGPEISKVVDCSMCGRKVPVRLRTGADFFRPKFERPEWLRIKKAGLEGDT